MDVIAILPSLSDSLCQTFWHLNRANWTHQSLKTKHGRACRFRVFINEKSIFLPFLGERWLSFYWASWWDIFHIYLFTESFALINFRRIVLARSISLFQDNTVLYSLSFSALALIALKLKIFEQFKPMVVLAFFYCL